MFAFRINRMWRASALALASVALFAARPAAAETVTVAVASNFTTTLELLAPSFESASGHRLRVSSASTGKLYAQIVNGAPFDVFLAADVAHPRLLEANGLAVGGSRFTYATGRLVLWSRHTDIDCRTWLGASAYGRLAIANPVHAPYGVAARETLEGLDVWVRFADRLVTGENIAQTLQFAASGNATAGLIAAAQLNAEQLPPTGCSWPVPEELHAPIEQQAVVLARAADSDAAREFTEFLRSAATQALIARSGYSVPGG